MGGLSGFDIVKTHREFSYVYNNSKAWHSKSVVLFFLPQQDTHKVGFTATKKIGNAVKRNRAKRRMRALFCKYSKNLKDGLYVFVAKQSMVDAPFDILEKDFKRVLKNAKVFA